MLPALPRLCGPGAVTGSLCHALSLCCRRRRPKLGRRRFVPPSSTRGPLDSLPGPELPSSASAGRSARRRRRPPLRWLPCCRGPAPPARRRCAARLLLKALSAGHQVFARGPGARYGAWWGWGRCCVSAGPWAPRAGQGLGSDGARLPQCVQHTYKTTSMAGAPSLVHVSEGCRRPKVGFAELARDVGRSLPWERRPPRFETHILQPRFQGGDWRKQRRKRCRNEPERRGGPAGCHRFCGF